MRASSSDVVKVVETLFIIPNKKGEIVPFHLNNVQKHFMENKADRSDILKFRQGGVTSIVMAWFLVECMHSFTRAVMIAHDSDATKKLLQRGRFMLQTMKGAKPSLSRDSDQELAFPKTGSTFYIGTAGTRTFGRSDTITHLHCSEYAFWPDPKALSSSLFQAVPHATGVVVRESTANGYGTYHHQQVVRAMKGSSRFRLLFYPWFIFDEYESGTPLIGELDEMEEELKKKFNLSDEKLQWRREKIEDMNGDVNQFCQEYPSTIEEAFLMSGGSMFPKVSVDVSPNWIKARELSRLLGGSLHLLSTHLDLSGRGGLSLESRALPGRHYSFGIDVSGGTGNDFSEVQGVCLETMEQVLVFRSNSISPPQFAKVVALLGTIFNNAFLVPESNSHGLSVIACLRELAPYNEFPNLLYRQRFVQKSQMMDRAKRLGALGYRTTQTSKYFLIGVLQQLLPDITLYDTPTVDQLRGFGEQEEGKLGNVEEAHDDAVMALALACEGILKLRLRHPIVGQLPIEERITPPSTQVDFDDIFSRLTPAAGLWRQLFHPREANHGHHLRH